MPQINMEFKEQEIIDYIKKYGYNYIKIENDTDLSDVYEAYFY